MFAWYVYVRADVPMADSAAAGAAVAQAVLPLPPAPASGLEAFTIREQDISVGALLGRGEFGVALECSLPTVAKVRSTVRQVVDLQSCNCWCGFVKLVRTPCSPTSPCS